MAKDFLVVLMTGGGQTGEDGDNGEHIHIEGGGCYHTLCGYCDCMGAVQEWASEIGKPNCPECLHMLEHTRKFTRTMIPT